MVDGVNWVSRSSHHDYPDFDFAFSVFGLRVFCAEGVVGVFAFDIMTAIPDGSRCSANGCEDFQRHSECTVAGIPQHLRVLGCLVCNPVKHVQQKALRVKSNKRQGGKS